MGLYPAVPGSGEFLLHAPRFKRVTLRLGNGKRLRIDAPGADGRALQYVDSVRWNGKPQQQVVLDWAQLQRGGTLSFALTRQAPTQGWGTQADALPTSFCATPGAAP